MHEINGEHHRTRKRTRNPILHKAAIKHRKFQNGEEYVNASGALVKKKTFDPQAHCPCRFKCSDKINISTQKTIFEQYYYLKNWTQKTLYLRSLVDRGFVEENLNSLILQKRKFQCKYYLNDSDGIRQRVCLSFLSNCLCISQSTLKKTSNYVQKNPDATENRGQFPTRKYNDHDVNFLRECIKSFPQYDSHYSNVESGSQRKYLSPFLNIKRMYREYRIKCAFKKKKCLPEWKYRFVFNTEFNLRFGRLKVDTCRKCDSIEANLQSEKRASKRDELLKMREEHYAIVKRTKNDIKDCIAHACIPQNKEEFLVFDLQRALEVPSISVSDAFYKRQLWCYNLCVYDKVRKSGFMYVWDESIASRGAQEISSCLYKYLTTYMPKDTKKLFLLSDSCSGQNKNIKLAMMLKNFLANQCNRRELQEIEHMFFVSGHSYNSCDQCFGVIEKQRKVTENIYIPNH